MKIGIGSNVALRNKVRKTHTCPSGREDNCSARIINIYGENKDQVMVDRDLHGCRFWNLADLKLAKG